MKWSIPFFLSIFLIICQPGTSNAQTITVSPDLKYLKAQLKKKKFSPRFIDSILKNYDAESFGTTLRMNMLGFLNPPQHRVLVTEEGKLKSEEFIERNKKSFLKVTKRDKVPASVIAALLWVETKHGKLTGRYHVTSVFAHLMQVTRKEVIAELTNLAIEGEKAKPNPTKKLRKLMRDRIKRKAEWAIGELKALEKLYRKDKKMVGDLQGSFAGAFGIPQFIPSSYWTYSRPLVVGRVCDLYDPGDAISSVGNYLKKTGWNSKKKSRQMQALMHYNNSQDYAESILDLSKKINSEPPASGQFKN